MRKLLSTVLLAMLFAPPANAGGKGDPIAIRLSTKGNDIAFDTTAIQVPFGLKVKLRFINEAEKDSQILHNVAVLKPGSLDEVIKDLQANGYEIEKMRGHRSVLAMTKALEPGAEDTLEFSPGEPGFYPYICLMAGHADMLGMKGTLNIKK